jgi:Type IIB DNA topoisomerase
MALCMLLVMSYGYELLRRVDQHGRTKTSYIQTLYYAYIKYFTNKHTCNRAIKNVCHLLQVTREALGLKASPKGWLHGSIGFLDRSGTSQWNGETYDGDEDFLITSEWLKPPNKRNFSINPLMSAKSIVVVESESFYQILVQGGFSLNYKCILVTAKGMPDVATRACVYALHMECNLPVYGIADCNPFGAGILYCYQNGYENQYCVPLQWLGLRPSQVERLLEPQFILKAIYGELPSTQYQGLFAQMFQEVSDRDNQKVIEYFLSKKKAHPFVTNSETNSEANSEARAEEIEDMLQVKMELEALCCFGRDFCSKFFGFLLEKAKQENASNEWSWKHAI